MTTLLDLIEHGTGGAAYYTDVMEALVALAVYAPCGPPASSADFLTRLDADWLAAAYAAATATGRRSPPYVPASGRSKTCGCGSARCGGGSARGSTAAVIRGLRRLVLRAGGDRGGGGRGGAGTGAHRPARLYALRGEREILLCVDEFSAVSRRLPIWRLYERARSLGLAVQVSAQSWEGLAGSQDERQRVAATAEGGIWLLRTPRPEPVVELAGTMPSVDTSRRFAGAGPWGDDGLSRTRLTPVLDGDLVRRLDVGQACYVYRGGVTFLQVKRLTGRQAEIGSGTGVRSPDGAAGRAAVRRVPRSSPAPPPAGRWPRVCGARPGAAGRGRAARRGGRRAARATRHGPGRLADVSEVLDEAFGKP